MRAVNPTFPKARTEELIVEALPEETLVYDLKEHEAHCLNRTVTLVWRYSDGRKSVADIAALLKKEGRSSFDAEEVVWASLEALDKARLLQDHVAAQARTVGLSRRNVVRLGVATALAAPVILSIVAPEASRAATCGGNGALCNNKDDCCPGCSCTGSGASHKTCQNCP